jgi:hypothetical protein
VIVVSYSQLFSVDNRNDKTDFFKIPTNIQNYFDLKNKEEDLDKEIAKRIIEKVSEKNQKK